jgi:hypothetical protein
MDAPVGPAGLATGVSSAAADATSAAAESVAAALDERGGQVRRAPADSSC